jgi:urease accessory protein
MTWIKIMPELTLIKTLPRQHEGSDCLTQISLLVNRTTLAKRRWRGVAEDGREFGFDLDRPMDHGHYFFHENDTSYFLKQMPEEVLEIPVVTLEQAARVAWSLGNLHFGVQVLDGSVRVTEDPAVLQLLAREGIAFQRVTCIFLPLSAGAHHHDHGHHHG